MNEFVLGNGQLLLNYNAHCNLTDLYFPHPGHRNHVNGNLCGIAVGWNGELRWLDGAWRPQGCYLDGGCVARTRFHDPGGRFRLTLHMAVHPSRPALLLGASVENLTDCRARVVVYFYHNFRIQENSVGDTVFWHPEIPGLVHYKEDVYLLAAGRDESGSWTCEWDIGRRDGSERPAWRAIEECHMARAPIRQGDVDSALALGFALPARGTACGDYFLVCGRSLSEVFEEFRELAAHSVPRLQEQSGLFASVWSARSPLVSGASGGGVPAHWREAAAGSLLIVRTQIDRGGGILAANDTSILAFNRDHYSYVWPRDGALVARAMLGQGYPEIARNFLEFFGRVISPGGFSLHKFRPDGTLGSSWHPWLWEGAPSLPIQEDETALPLALLGHYFSHTGDVDFIERSWRRWGAEALGFLLRFRDADGLPLPSYDLWEERRGVHVFTVAAVALALREGAAIARALGRFEEAEEAVEAWERMAGAFDGIFWDEGRGNYARCRYPDGSFDFTADSSSHALWDFGLRPPDCPRLHRAMENTWEALRVRTPLGGVSRYERDYYHRVTEDYAKVPGNPWVISTLWCAIWNLRAGRRDQYVNLVETVLARRNSYGLLPEQWHPHTGAPLSVSPLTWSHAVLLEAMDQGRHRTAG